MPPPIFIYDPEARSVVSLRASIEVLGKQWMLQDTGCSILFRIDGNIRGLTAWFEYIRCPNGVPMIMNEGAKLARYCVFWKQVSLGGSVLLNSDEFNGRVHSEPFKTDSQRAEFMEIAIEFLKELRVDGAPVHKIELPGENRAGSFWVRPN